MKDVTVLFPGGFKPCTGGHLSLIRRYSEHPSVKEVWVLVGPGVREGISQHVAVEILENLTEGMPKVFIQAVPWPSPVLACYKIVEAADPGCYALAASSKEEENAKRIKDFVFKHSNEGKFYRPDVQVVELPINIEPKLYEGRTDEKEGKPISASILREDLIKGDLRNFITAYPDLSEEQVSFIWDTLEQSIILPDVEPLSEALNTSGTPTVSSSGGYDRSQPGYNYRSQFPIADLSEEDEEEPLKDWEWNETKKTWTRKK
jgi:hypothetical protein